MEKNEKHDAVNKSLQVVFDGASVLYNSTITVQYYKGRSQNDLQTASASSFFLPMKKPAILVAIKSDPTTSFFGDNK